MVLIFDLIPKNCLRTTTIPWMLSLHSFISIINPIIEYKTFACILCDIQNVTHFLFFFYICEYNHCSLFFARPKKPFTDGWSAWYDT